MENLNEEENLEDNIGKKLETRQSASIWESLKTIKTSFYNSKLTLTSKLYTKHFVHLSILFSINFGPVSQIKAGGHLISQNVSPSQIRLWSRKEDGNQLKWVRKMKPCKLQRTRKVL